MEYGRIWTDAQLIFMTLCNIICVILGTYMFIGTLFNMSVSMYALYIFILLASCSLFVLQVPEFTNIRGIKRIYLAIRCVFKPGGKKP